MNPSAERRLPLTVVTGFYGSGKTTFIQDFLAEDKGGPVAVFTMHPTEADFDAGLLRGVSTALKRTDHFVDFRDDTLAPAWKEPLRNQLAEAAQANRYGRALLEAPATLDPRDLNRLFAPDEPAVLERIVHLIEPIQFWHEVVHGRGTPSLNETQIAQIKAATDLFIRLGEEMPPDSLAQCRDYVRLLNPAAAIHEAHHAGAGELGAIFSRVPASAPDLSFAEPHHQHPDDNWPRGLLFQSRRPFHPERFHEAFFQDWPQIYRIKGFFWLASRFDAVGGLSQAGPFFTCGLAGQWWASIDREGWPPTGPERDRILHHWQEPYGDRRQELTLIGSPRGLEKLLPALDGALLTDDEMLESAQVWSRYPDPFPAWEVESG